MNTIRLFKISTSIVVIGVVTLIFLLLFQISEHKKTQATLAKFAATTPELGATEAQRLREKLVSANKGLADSLRKIRQIKIRIGPLTQPLASRYPAETAELQRTVFELQKQSEEFESELKESSLAYEKLVSALQAEIDATEGRDGLSILAFATAVLGLFTGISGSIIAWRKDQRETNELALKIRNGNHSLTPREAEQNGGGNGGTAP